MEDERIVRLSFCSIEQDGEPFLLKKGSDPTELSDALI